MKLRFSLTAKLLLLIATAASIPLAALVGFSLYLRETIQADMEQKIETTLTLAMNMESSFVDEGLFAMKQVATAVAHDTQVQAALTGPGARPDLARLAKVFPRADTVVVVDRTGSVVARSTSEHTGDRYSLNGLVEHVMSFGERQAYPALIPWSELQAEGPQIHELVDMPILETRQSTDPRFGTRVDTALALVGVAPILGPDGTLLGAAVAADILNRDYRIVDEVVLRSPAEVPMNATIAMDGIRVTTNVKLKDPEGHQTDARALGTVYSDVVMESLRAGNTYRGRATVVEETTRTIYSPLRDYMGNVIAGPYVGIPEAYFTAVEARLTRYVNLAVGAGLGVLVLVVVLGLWMTRRGVVSPINRFIAQIRSGDVGKRISHPAGDEIGDLAKALDEFLQRIVSMIGQVRSVAEEVALASKTLHGAASQTSSEAGRALWAASTSFEKAKELQAGAQLTIHRLTELGSAVSSVAEGASRQERSIRYTGTVTEEIAGTVVETRDRAAAAMEAAGTLTNGARSGLKQAAAFMAALSILRQRAENDRVLDLLQDPSPVITGMAEAAERLVGEVRHLALAVQENSARLSTIEEEMTRVRHVVAETAASMQEAGGAAAEVIRWMETMAGSVGKVADQAEATQTSMHDIAIASRALLAMSARMNEAAEQLHQALEQFKES